jgi:4-amino-4-deoxy-L-arabinose transferase-like glycosyltransferase
MVDLVSSPAPLRYGVRTAQLAEAAAVIAVLALALWLRVPNLDAYTGSFDEGIRAEQLLLMASGYRPFQDIFASQGPLLLDLLYPFYLAFGQTLTAARAGVVVCSIVAILGAGWTARLVAGPIAGLAAMLLLAISPTFLDGSRLALAEVPTAAPALLALGCLVAYRCRRDRRLLVLSAAGCALSLLIKPMALHVGVPIAVLLLAPALGDAAPVWPWRRRLADLAAYGVVVGVICGLVVALLGPAQVWDNLGAYRGGAGHRLGADAIPNLRLTFNVMRQEQAGLFVLAVVGVLLGLWRRPVSTVALVAWALAVLGLFVLYGDLADKHIVYLMPAVALLAAIGAGLGVEAIGSLGRVLARAGGGVSRPRPGAVLWATLSVMGIASYLATLPAVYVADQYLLRVAPKVAAERRGRATDLEIAEIIRSHTPADGWVLADNPLAAFVARRRVIPYLVDTSGTRIDAGSLTAPLAIDQIQRYQPAVIVTWPRRLGKLDQLTQRLPELGYHQEKSYELGWRVYVRDVAGLDGEHRQPGSVD